VSRRSFAILDLQAQPRVGPSTWLARAIEQHKPRDVRRFDEMELEGWVE
jgi:nitrogen fixation protein NifX